MNIATPAVKRPATLAVCLLLGLFSIIAAGCDARKPASASGATAREAELTKTVEELRGKLAAAEQAAEQAKAQAAVVLEQLKTTPAAQAKAGPSADPASAADPQPADTSYVVVKKNFNAGQLIPVTSANPNATERRPAQYWITFKGVPSGKEYPALEVKESAYSQFREGADYSPQDINQAKANASTNGAPATPSP